MPISSYSVGAMSLTWWNCARGAVRLDLRRPGDRHRRTRAAKVRSDQLGGFERRIARPGPAGVVHVVGLVGADGIQPADLVQCGNLLVDRVRDVVLRQQFADRTALAFGARAVVAEDVHDDRVVALAEALQLRR
jgi:hypothetical protein